jgi:hypothetical protein
LDLLRPTTTVAGVSPGCLGRGDQGDEVRDLQQRLNALGANPLLAVDGTFGPRTEVALGQSLRGTKQFCPEEEQLLSTLLDDFSRVPDVRRLDKAAAEAQFTGPASFTVSYSERCSASVDVGAVVAVQYVRLDGVPIIVFDAERPTDSATTLAPSGTTLEVVVSTGPCPVPELSS